MNVTSEIQKIEQRQNIIAAQMRSEFSRFSSETKTILNSLDERINERVQEEVGRAFGEIKLLIQNLRLRGVV